MPVDLFVNKVGPWPMNSYLVVCRATGLSAIIDPGADADSLLSFANKTKVDKILITHGHGDHVGALAAVKAATGVPAYIHPADAQKFGIAYDVALDDENYIPLGQVRIRTWHTPGHTPGQTCFDLEDGRIVVGDTVFVGGPGATRTPDDFQITMKTMQSIVFRWPDSTQFYPGHGDAGNVGKERQAFQDFLARGWSKDLCGDVLWE